MVGLIGIGAIVLFVIILVGIGYVKASPDTAYVISGPRKKPKYIIGRAGLRIPFLDKKDEITLKLIAIDVKTSKPVPTLDYINIDANAAVNVKVGASEEMLDKAATNFLNKSEEDIVLIAKEVLEGNMREIIGMMDLKTMVNNRQAFNEKVKENAAPDLANMGLEIVNFNVQSFSDEQGAIENLGIDNLTKIRKDAAIAKAQNEKEIAIAQASALKEANDAKVEADLKISEKQNELAIKKSELKKTADIEKAKADAAYEIQSQEQRKALEVAEVNATIARQEKNIELQDKEIAIKERSLDAEIKKKADADKYAAEKKIEAQFYADTKEAEADLIRRQKNAEATRYEEEQAAEAIKARAKANKFEAEQKAAGILAQGEAEAAAIRAKGLAEAEAILKKAEAQEKMGEASKMEMLFAVLPAIVENASKPLNNVDKITLYGEGNQAKIIEDVMTSVDKVSNGLGLDIKSLISGIAGGLIADKN